MTDVLLTQTGVQRSSQWALDMNGFWAIAVSFGSRRAISIRCRPSNLHEISPAEFSSSHQRNHRTIGSKAWSKIGLLEYGRLSIEGELSDGLGISRPDLKHVNPCASAAEIARRGIARLAGIKDVLPAIEKGGVSRLWKNGLVPGELGSWQDVHRSIKAAKIGYRCPLTKIANIPGLTGISAQKLIEALMRRGVCPVRKVEVICPIGIADRVGAGDPARPVSGDIIGGMILEIRTFAKVCDVAGASEYLDICNLRLDAILSTRREHNDAMRAPAP